MEVARRNRHSRLARRSTSSRSTAVSASAIRGHGLLERSVVVGILQRDNDGLGGQSMANRILRSALLAKVGLRTGAAQGIAPVGLNLSGRGHGYGHGSGIGFVFLVRWDGCREVRPNSPGPRLRRLGRSIRGRGIQGCATARLVALPSSDRVRLSPKLPRGNDRVDTL